MLNEEKLDFVIGTCMYFLEDVISDSYKNEIIFNEKTLIIEFNEFRRRSFERGLYKYLSKFNFKCSVKFVNENKPFLLNIKSKEHNIILYDKSIDNIIFDFANSKQYSFS